VSSLFCITASAKGFGLDCYFKVSNFKTGKISTITPTELKNIDSNQTSLSKGHLAKIANVSIPTTNISCDLEIYKKDLGSFLKCRYHKKGAAGPSIVIRSDRSGVTETPLYNTLEFYGDTEIGEDVRIDAICQEGNR
jgi:hypothetical protein